MDIISFDDFAFLFLLAMIDSPPFNYLNLIEKNLSGRVN
jgi:hypothetical protein